MKKDVLIAGLIVLTGPGGQTIDVNSHKIVSLRETQDRAHYGKGVNCIVNTEDGKYIAVIETCAVVLGKFNEDRKY